jgi:hypothetical protein
MTPSLTDYGRAEGRLRESIWLRCNGLPMHDYPRRQDALATIREFHAAYGVPPAGFFRRLVWWLAKLGQGLTLTTERPARAAGRGREGRVFAQDPSRPNLERGEE